MLENIRFIFSLIAIPTLLGLFSCSGSDEGNVDSFDREQMLIDFADRIILPAFENFETSTAELASAVDVLSNDVNQSNLDNAQQAWLKTARSWAYAEMFMMGPVDQKVLSGSINNWPASIASIEEAIDTEEVIDKAYINSLGSSRKGLPALEYLLFDFEAGDETVLQLFSGDERRIDYLVALSRALNDIAKEANEGWKPSGENYYQVFVSNVGKDAASSINVLANELLMLIERIKNEKIGVPLGKKSMGVIIPENVQARFSGESIILIYSNLNAIEAIITGDVDNTPGLGYTDYLDAVGAEFEGQPLSAAIIEEIANLRDELANLTVPLKTAVQTETPMVEEAYNAAQRIVVLTKADMMSQLGLLVTYTDNDGD